MTSDLRDMPPITANSGGKGIELSAYDEQRQPHLPINDDTEVVAAPRSLQAELCCPICLDLLTSTMTTKECLHRFCSECIQMAMTRGNKECPTCRKKLVSRRSLRPDPNFDTLIAKIYPSRDAYNDAQNQALELFQKNVNTEALQQSIQAGIKAQAKLRKQRVQGSYDYEKRKRKPKTVDETVTTPVDVAPPGLTSQSPTQPAHDSDSCSSAPTGATSTTAPGDEASWLSNEVEIILQPAESVLFNNSLCTAVKQTRYLKTTQHATMAHICSYLKTRIDQDTNDAKSFLLKTQNQGDKTDDGVRTPSEYLLYAEMTHQPTINRSNALPKTMALQTHIQSLLSAKSRRLYAPLTLIFNVVDNKE